MIEFIKEAAFGLAVGQLVLIASIFVIFAAAVVVFGILFVCSVVVGEVKGKAMTRKLP